MLVLGVSAIVAVTPHTVGVTHKPDSTSGSIHSPFVQRFLDHVSIDE